MINIQDIIFISYPYLIDKNVYRFFYENYDIFSRFHFFKIARLLDKDIDYKYSSIEYIDRDCLLPFSNYVFYSKENFINGKLNVYYYDYDKYITDLKSIATDLLCSSANISIDHYYKNADIPIYIKRNNIKVDLPDIERQFIKSYDLFFIDLDSYYITYYVFKEDYYYYVPSLFINFENFLDYRKKSFDIIIEDILVYSSYYLCDYLYLSKYFDSSYLDDSFLKEIFYCSSPYLFRNSEFPSFQDYIFLLVELASDYLGDTLTFSYETLDYLLNSKRMSL